MFLTECVYFHFVKEKSSVCHHPAHSPEEHHQMAFCVHEGRGCLIVPGRRWYAFQWKKAEEAKKKRKKSIVPRFDFQSREPVKVKFRPSALWTDGGTRIVAAQMDWFRWNDYNPPGIFSLDVSYEGIRVKLHGSAEGKKNNDRCLTCNMEESTDNRITMCGLCSSGLTFVLMTVLVCSHPHHPAGRIQSAVTLCRKHPPAEHVSARLRWRSFFFKKIPTEKKIIDFGRLFAGPRGGICSRRISRLINTLAFFRVCASALPYYLLQLAGARQVICRLAQ